MVYAYVNFCIYKFMVCLRCVVDRSLGFIGGIDMYRQTRNSSMQPKSIRYVEKIANISYKFATNRRKIF